MIEKKYEDAIAVLSEIILNQRQTKQHLEWQIERLNTKIYDLETKAERDKNEVLESSLS